MGAIDTVLSPVIWHTDQTSGESCRCPMNRDHTYEEAHKRYVSEWWEFVFGIAGMTAVGLVTLGILKIFGALG